MFTKVEELECFPFSLKSKGSQCCLLPLQQLRQGPEPVSFYLLLVSSGLNQRLIVEYQVHATPLSSTVPKVKPPK